MATQLELYHYGVKGMKWGIRKSARLVGQHIGRKWRNRPTKQQKIQRRQERQKQREQRVAKQAELTRNLNIMNNYSDEYRNSREGKAKLNRLHKAEEAWRNDIYDNGGDDSNDSKFGRAFDAAERDYLTSMGRYEANRYIQEYGQEAFDSFARDYRVRAASGQSMVDAYADMSYYVHGS